MRLAFVGDVMLGRLVNRCLKRVPAEYPWGDTLPLLRTADAVFINLECVIADRGKPWPRKVFTFRTDSRNVEVLRTAHVTVASLANNHSLDYGAEALLDCLEILQRHGIWAVGAGATLGAARLPAVLAVCGARIAVIAVTDNEPEWQAGEETPGVFFVPFADKNPRLHDLFALVEDVRKASDLVIVSAHWGPNWGRTPLPEHVEAAHRLIDAGADVVFGHSPHILRGIEIYRGRPILYSCGNFVDDYAVDEDERNDESGIFSIECDQQGVRRVLFTPTVITRFQARLARGADWTRILGQMRTVCAGLGTDTREASEGLEISVSPVVMAER
ncbi:MAG TPA: CapA family protein [bacterium]|nr:CapA family protein [bacterium]